MAAKRCTPSAAGRDIRKRMAQKEIHQSTALVHDPSRDSLDALRPHLVSAKAANALSEFTKQLDVARPFNVAQVRQISPFRYPGGKTWLVPVAREWLQMIDRPRVLLEPFAGGAVIGLTAAAEGLADKVVLVEIDDDVSAVWEVLINGADRSVTMLSNKILRFDVTRDNVREVLDGTPRTTVERAFRTIVKNRTQRGGIMAPGAGLVKEGEAGRGLRSRWYPETLVKRFDTIRQFRDRITFMQGDAFDAIRSNPGAAMFVDPPYTAAGKRAGSRLYTHTELDHRQLFDDVANYAGPALLTYDDSDEIRNMAVENGFQVGNVAMKSTHNVVMRELTIFKA